MFSPKRSLVFFILFGSLTLEFCTSATASAVPSTTDEPSTRIAPRPGMLVSKPNIARLSAVPVWDVLNLPMRITEDTSPTNDTDNGDSLTDTGASPPRPTRLSIALTVCAVGFCLLCIYWFIRHPPSQLIDERVRPSISHLSDRVPPSIVILFQRAGDMYHRLISQVHLPKVAARTSLLPPLGGFSVKSRRRRGAGSFRVGESRLVQWAQEDMGMLDMDSEADFMVNAEDSTEADDLIDEYIPLSVGMGWKGRPGSRIAQGSPLPIQNYGTATRW